MESLKLNDVVFGVDVGFKTSASAIAVLKNMGTTLEIVEVFKLDPFASYGGTKEDFFCRNMVLHGIERLMQIYLPKIVIIEKPMFQSKANENFLKFFGLFENLCYEEGMPFLYVPPTTVKAKLGGGRLEKDEMAERCLHYCTGKKCQRLIRKAIKNGEWDITDSIAIGIAGLLIAGQTDER